MLALCSPPQSYSSWLPSAPHAVTPLHLPCLLPCLVSNSLDRANKLHWFIWEDKILEIFLEIAGSNPSETCYGWNKLAVYFCVVFCRFVLIKTLTFLVCLVFSVSVTTSLYINRVDTNTYTHIRDKWTTRVFLFIQKVQEENWWTKCKIKNKTNWNSEILTVKELV